MITNDSKESIGKFLSISSKVSLAPCFSKVLTGDTMERAPILRPRVKLQFLRGGGNCGLNPKKVYARVQAGGAQATGKRQVVRAVSAGVGVARECVATVAARV